MTTPRLSIVTAAGTIRPPRYPGETCQNYTCPCDTCTREKRALRQAGARPTPRQPHHARHAAAAA